MPTPLPPVACDELPRLNRLARARPSIFYRIGLAAVAVAMVVLPFLYAAVTTAVGWGVYLFGLHCVPAILQWDLGFSHITLLAMFVCIVTPIATGCAIVFFMIKPVFARRERPPVGAVHNPAFEPEIGAFIEAVCHAIGARAPRRIDFTCGTDASAGFVGGWRGFLRNRMVLTLGLSLVGTVTQRELAGILAHEFGHFRQGIGMRLSFVIREVNSWFARSVYGRDRWDEILQHAAETQHNWAGFMSVFASLGVMGARAVLWLVMMLGHGISAFLMRQMERDADAAEIQLAGSDAFSATMRKLVTLDAVRRLADQQIGEIWHFHHHLPDNLPGLLEHRMRAVPPQLATAVDLHMRTSKTGWAATHPSPHARVEQACKMGCSGQNLSDAPARDLFRQFDDLCRAVTIGHYHNLGLAIASNRLLPLSLLVGNSSSDRLREPETPAEPELATIPFAFDEPVTAAVTR